MKLTVFQNLFNVLQGVTIWDTLMNSFDPEPACMFYSTENKIKHLKIKSGKFKLL